MDHGEVLPVALTRSSRRAARIDWPAISAWTCGFALVTYLALRNGGYDTIVRSEVGVAIWWVLLLGVLAGVLPTRIGRAGWGATALLTAFAIWTGIAISWSQSPEASVLELGREATYVGFLLLALALQRRTAARHTINGIACAIGLVAALAVLSRLHPQAFPINVQFQFLGAGAGRRLSYPLNYWNALAALIAIGVPLFVALAIRARTIVFRALAAAMLPLSALAIYLTVSRGGVLELSVGLVVFTLLVPRRLEALATTVIGAGGAAILIWAADRRPAVQTGLRDPTATHAGTKLLILTILVCLGVALLQAAIALLPRSLERPGFLKVSRRVTARASVAIGCLVVIAALAAGGGTKLDHAWQQFKAPTGVVVPTSNSTVITRLSAINGNGRYQYWVAAVHAVETRPWGGIGPGTFQFWWAAHATVAGAVLNAHSLYMETLAETGIVGVALLVGMLLFVVATGVRRSLRATDSARIWISAAAAGLAAFMTAAAIDWVWQMAAIVATALALAAVVLAGPDDLAPLPSIESPARPLARWLPRAAVASGALAALVAIAIPLAGAIAVRQSQLAAQHGDLRAAYRDSLTAEQIQPYAGTPYLQEALVLEAAGNLTQATRAARIATRNEPTAWQIWLTLARIESERGADRQAVADLATARRLNRLGSVFTTR